MRAIPDPEHTSCMMVAQEPGLSPLPTDFASRLLVALGVENEACSSDPQLGLERRPGARSSIIASVSLRRRAGNFTRLRLEQLDPVQFADRAFEILPSSLYFPAEQGMSSRDEFVPHHPLHHRVSPRRDFPGPQQRVEARSRAFARLWVDRARDGEPETVGAPRFGPRRLRSSPLARASGDDVEESGSSASGRRPRPAGGHATGEPSPPGPGRRADP